MTPHISYRSLTQILCQIPRWRIKWRPCKSMAVSQAFIFNFKCYSILHFAVCHLLCWAFMLSKLPEKVIKTQLQVYLDDIDAMPKLQSAHRRYHSAETALVKVYNDLLTATDNGRMSEVCSLDFTDVFGTVDRELLLQKLERVSESKYWHYILFQIIPDWQNLPCITRRYDVDDGVHHVFSSA